MGHAKKPVDPVLMTHAKNPWLSRFRKQNAWDRSPLFPLPLPSSCSPYPPLPFVHFLLLILPLFPSPSLSRSFPVPYLPFPSYSLILPVHPSSIHQQPRRYSQLPHFPILSPVPTPPFPFPFPLPIPLVLLSLPLHSPPAPLKPTKGLGSAVSSPVRSGAKPQPT